MKKRHNKLFGKELKRKHWANYVDPIWGKAVPPEYKYFAGKEFKKSLRLFSFDKRKEKRQAAKKVKVDLLFTDGSTLKGNATLYGVIK